MDLETGMIAGLTIVVVGITIYIWILILLGILV
jgi:hypothetical protein